MKVTVIRAGELDASCRSRWAEIQQSDGNLESPYFCVEFTEALAAVRDDVYVAILEDGPRIIGFFPYHRRSFGFGRPVGLGLSDYHGVIVEPGASWSAEELLRGCGLVRWEFDHLLAAQTQFHAFHQITEPSPIIEVGDGFEAYKERHTQMGGSEFKTIFRRMRKLKNEYPDYRFIEYDTSREHLDQVFALKSAQCRETGAYDFFAIPWTREFMRRLLETRSPRFSGILSSTVAGDRCLAVHFGIRTEKVWHWWFPCYDKTFASYSPGLILLMEVIQRAAEDGLSHIDLGKGVARYKQNVMTGSIEVASGSLTRSSIIKYGSKAIRWLERDDHGPGMKQLTRLPRGVIRRVRNRMRFA